jgi:hypothetical protein
VYVVHDNEAQSVTVAATTGAENTVEVPR